MAREMRPISSIKVEVRTQAELDKALESTPVRDGEELIVLLGDRRFVLTDATPWIRCAGQANPTIENWGHANPRIENWEQANPRIVNRGHANPRIVNREQANPRIENWEQANPRIVNREQANPRIVNWGQANPTIVNWGQAKVTGTVGRYCHVVVYCHGEHSNVDLPGAIILDAPKIETAEDWLDYYGIEADDGLAVLYKAVGDDFVSSRSFGYEPGSEPVCADWDPDPGISCGSGLHFCPAPSIALGYRADAARFVACPVKVAEIVLSKAYGEEIPDKVRAPRVAAPVVECDIDGVPVEAKEAA